MNDLTKKYVIVIGNEKGGAGKTTSAMHLIASLMELGFLVASIDADTRQLSLSRYIENRLNTCVNNNITLKISNHYILKSSNLTDLLVAQQEESANFLNTLNRALEKNDFVVIDTPGSNSYLSRLAHSYADLIITPINDSFVDLDVIAKIRADDYQIEKPSIYSQMVWEQKMLRAKRDQASINWLVIRNRLSTLDAKNKRNMAQVLDKLANRIGFRVSSGFGERVIFRELFLNGLTLLDLKEELADKIEFTQNLSHLAAKQELRDFLKSLQIPAIEQAMLIVA